MLSTRKPNKPVLQSQRVVRALMGTKKPKITPMMPKTKSTTETIARSVGQLSISAD